MKKKSVIFCAELESLAVFAAGVEMTRASQAGCAAEAGKLKLRSRSCQMDSIRASP